MRVLNVHAGNMYGGVESMMLTQLRHQGLCPDLEFSFAVCFDGRFSEELTAAGAPLHRLGDVRIRAPLSVRRARRNLKQLLQQEHFDVALTHSSWSQAIFGPAVRAAGVPLVFYLHGPADGRHWLERGAQRTLPDLALCNSRFTAATLPKLYPSIPGQIVYCPVAPPETSFSDADKKQTRSELQTSDEATVVIQVSRMETLKGHFVHLEALSLLKDLPDWICWQVGGAQRPDEVEYLDALRKRAAELGIAERVRFLGQRSDVARLLAAADIYCQPNIAPDSFGIAFVEALYASLPVVTSAIGGALEIVDDSVGRLVPPNDAGALAQALKRLIEDDDLRKVLGQAGPRRAQTLCDVSAHLHKLHYCFLHVINGNRKKSSASFCPA